MELSVHLDYLWFSWLLSVSDAAGLSISFTSDSQIQWWAFVESSGVDSLVESWVMISERSKHVQRKHLTSHCHVKKKNGTDLKALVPAHNALQLSPCFLTLLPRVNTYPHVPNASSHPLQGLIELFLLGKGGKA